MYGETQHDDVCNISDDTSVLTTTIDSDADGSAAATNNDRSAATVDSSEQATLIKAGGSEGDQRCSRVNCKYSWKVVVVRGSRRNRNGPNKQTNKKKKWAKPPPPTHQ